MAHRKPHCASHFRHLYSRNIIFGHKHHLGELLHVARLLVDTRYSLTASGNPHCAVAVAEDGVDGFASVLDEARVLAVGARIHLARLCADIHVVAVGIHRRDALLAKYSVLAQRLVIGAQSAHALVGANPQVALISLDDNRRFELSRSNQFVFKSPFRVFHLVYSHTLHDGEHFALRRDGHRVLSLQVFISLHAFKRIDDTVFCPFEHEHSTVIHSHPDVLPLVGDHVDDAVVEQRHLRRTASLVVEEVESVESRQSVPRTNPDISIVVLNDIRHSIATQPVFGGVVGLGC